MALTNIAIYLDKINNKKAFASLSPGGMINIWSAEEPLKTTPIETIDFKEGEYLNAKGARIPSFKLTDVSYYVDFNFEDFKKEDFIKEEDWSILKERFLKIDITNF